MIDERQPQLPETSTPLGAVGIVARLRRLFVLVIGVAFLLGIPGVTAHGACARQMATLCAAAPECGSGKNQPAGDDQSHEDGGSGICCKCPCNGLNVPVSPTSATMLSNYSASSQRRSVDDPERESPVFEIFQPPKLPV